MSLQCVTQSLSTLTQRLVVRDNIRLPNYDHISKNIGGNSSLSRHSMINRSSARLCASDSVLKRTMIATTRANKRLSAAWFLANKWSRHSNSTNWQRSTARRSDTGHRSNRHTDTHRDTKRHLDTHRHIDWRADYYHSRSELSPTQVDRKINRNICKETKTNKCQCSQSHRRT